jgi:predicted transcriptional regulator
MPKGAVPELREALLELGVGRLEAALVAVLAQGQALGTSDILERTGLRQPEVSTGMAMLRERDWIETEPIPRTGKGRPMHRYRLTVGAPQLRKHYQALGKKTIQRVQSALQAVDRSL